MPDPTEVRAAVHRFLSTDAVLGIRWAPLSPASSGPGATAGAHPVGAPAPSRAGSATRAAPPKRPPAGPVRKLQDIAAEELRRREGALQTLNEAQVRGCTKCALCETRTQTVFGQGHAGARLVFVGEAPGADEDAQGLAFVGRAGQLLTRMITAMGMTRDEVFICNILKCRPPDNRTPAPDEIAACWPFLDEQLRTIQPDVIVALGKPAAGTLLRTADSIGRLRGRWHDYYTSGSPLVGSPTPLMPTYHPAYLLRSPGEKSKAWSDLKMVMERLGLPIPERS